MNPRSTLRTAFLLQQQTQVRHRRSEKWKWNLSSLTSNGLLPLQTWQPESLKWLLVWNKYFMTFFFPFLGSSSKNHNDLRKQHLLLELNFCLFFSFCRICREIPGDAGSAGLLPWYLRREWKRSVSTGQKCDARPRRMFDENCHLLLRDLTIKTSSCRSIYLIYELFTSVSSRIHWRSYLILLIHFWSDLTQI